MILGEIKRFLRDGNSLRVSRSIRDVAYRILKVRESLEERDEEATIERIAEEAWNDVMNGYRDWDSMLGLFDQPLEYYLDDELSRYAEHNNYNHNINVQLRVVDEKYNLNAGIVVRPQRSHLVQDYWGQLVDTVRTVTNISPTLNFRYRFSKYSDLRLTYRGSTSQPSITSMLDITDDDISFEIEDFKIKRPEDIDPMYTEEDIKARYNDREAFLYICEPILFKIIGGVYIDEVSEKGLKIYPELDESESFWLKRM